VDRKPKGPGGRSLRSVPFAIFRAWSAASTPDGNGRDAAEKELADTKAQIKAVRRQARLAATLDVQIELQDKLQELERKQRRQRARRFSTLRTRSQRNVIS